jgi:hypothetical protein
MVLAQSGCRWILHCTAPLRFAANSAAVLVVFAAGFFPAQRHAKALATILDVQAKAMSDNDAAQHVNDARAMRFKTKFSFFISLTLPLLSSNVPLDSLFRSSVSR